MNGMIGLGLALLIGSRLGFDLRDSLFCIFVSNLAALVSLLTTLQAERTQWLRKFVLNRSLKTWSVLLFVYFGILFFFCPMLRDGKTFLLMIVPLVLATGFSILVFGPIQDRIVRRNQRNSR
jgi:hypothetical protein